MKVPLGEAYASECYRWVRRRFHWVSLVATTLVGFFGSVAPRIEELVRTVQESIAGNGRDRAAANAFVYLSTGSKGAAIVAAMFTVLAASAIVAGEAQSGTLRILLARPIDRIALFASKFACLLTYGLSLLAVGFSASIAGAAIVGDFGPVIAVIEKSSLAEMACRVLFAWFLSSLGLLGVLSTALLVSVHSRTTMGASAASLGILLTAELLTLVLDVARPYVFVSFVAGPFDTLRSHALGIDAPRPTWFGVPSFRDWADVAFALLVPTSACVLLTLVAARIFSRKDWLT